MAAGISKSKTESIDKQLDSLGPIHPNSCIYLVPENLRKVNEDAYRPLLVSIGPVYYRDMTDAMHQQKLRYFQHFCKRCKNNNTDYYLEVVTQKVDQARNYYVETIELPPGEEFINMLLLDAVFIIELFLRQCVDREIDSNDRIFSKPRMIIEITRDIRLAENQIPFFILKDLYRKIPASPNYPPLIDIAYKFFMGWTSVVPQRVRDADIGNIIKHIVDLLRLSHLPSSPRVDDNQKVEFEFTSGVTKLLERGVKFEASTRKNLLDIKFFKGVLEIPKLMVTDDTESLFRNIMVFEQCHHENDSYIIDYIAFLNSLINTPEDVEILVQSGIIENWLENNEEVASLISKLFKETKLRNSKFYYNNICGHLNEHAKKSRYFYITLLFTKYFNHPWAIIAVVYATVMLVLTVFQAYTGFVSMKGRQ